MAKTAFFRSSMFGYNKSEVNGFIEKQNERNLYLKQQIGELESRFEQYRRYYESLLKLHQENLTVLREIRMRAAKSEETVQNLQAVFQSLANSYRDLQEFANRQQKAVKSAQVYEEKARKYEEFARSMREMVLPGETAEQGLGLPELDLPDQALNSMDADALLRSAEDAFGALEADVQAFFSASERLQIPGDPDQNVQDASSL